MKGIFNRYNDEYIRQNYKTMSICQLVTYYEFKDLKLLEHIMETMLPSSRKLIKYQRLTVEFIKKYIVSEEYYDAEDEVTIEEIKRYQTHLTTDEIDEIRKIML